MGIPARVVVLTSGLLVLCAPLAIAEDVTITYKVTYGERGPPIRHKYISPGRAEAWSGPTLSKGLVLAETWSVDDRIVDSEEAVEFKTGPIDPSVFSAPLGYTKVESVSAAIIRENADVEYSPVGSCRQMVFTAAGADNDENVAWDATKKAWRSCVTERLGEKWTVIRAAKKQCFPRQNKMAWARVVVHGTEIVTCGQTGGDPKGKWFCHLDARLAPPRPHRDARGQGMAGFR